MTTRPTLSCGFLPASQAAPAPIDVEVVGEPYDEVVGVLEEFVTRRAEVEDATASTPRGDRPGYELRPCSFWVRLVECEGIPIELRGSRQVSIYQLEWVARADVTSIVEGPLGVSVRYDVEQD